MAATRSPAELARNLSHWAVTRGWCGTDPYDALNSSRRLTRPLTRTALGRRILIQAVKRCPLDLRPALGIRPGVDAATLALAVSAHARGSFLTAAEHAATLRGALRALEGLRSAGYKEPCWGYHFDVQSRVFFYAARRAEHDRDGVRRQPPARRATSAPARRRRSSMARAQASSSSATYPRHRVRVGRVLWLPGGRPLADPQLEPPRRRRCSPVSRARPRRRATSRKRPSRRRPTRSPHQAPGRLLALRRASQPRAGWTASTPATCSTRCGIARTPAGRPAEAEAPGPRPRVLSQRAVPRRRSAEVHGRIDLPIDSSASRRGSRLSRSRLATTRRTRSRPGRPSTSRGTGCCPPRACRSSSAADCGQTSCRTCAGRSPRCCSRSRT